MYDVIKNVIESGRYELNDMLEKIDTIWIQGDITEEQKKELAARTEEKKKAFDGMLERETADRTRALRERMEQEKARELEALREQTEKQLLQIQHKYDTEHDKISDEILQSMIRT